MNKTLLCAALAATLAAGATAANALPLAYASGQNGALYQIDLATGATVKQSVSFDGGNVNGIGLDAAANTIYYSANLKTGNVTDRHLERITLGVNTDLGSLTSLNTPSDSADGDYYAGSYWYVTDQTTGGYSGDQLIRVNLNASGNPVGFTNLGSVNNGTALGGITDISFVATGSAITTAYITAGKANLSTVTVNTTANTVSSLTSLPTPARQYAGLSYDPVANALYGIQGLTNQTSTLYKISTGTGAELSAITITGDAVGDRLSDLTGAVQVGIAIPEAGSLALIGCFAMIPLLGVVLRRKR